MTGAQISLDKPLFPRLDQKKEKPAAAGGQTKSKPAKTKKAAALPAAAADDGLISFADFQRLDLRAATIVAAEKVVKSDRLLKLTVETPEKRTIVAGIAEYYSPEEVIGRQVIVVANLQPAKLMGIASHGMVLAAKDGSGRLVLSSVSEDVPAGSKVA